METPKDNLAKLLDARAHIDEELRRHKSTVTVIFTDVVGSTAYFDRYGDTAGVAMMHRHAEVAGTVFKASSGRIIKTIGDSVMAEFPTPIDAVRGAIELQSRVLLLNTTLPVRDQLQLRIGINCGPGFRQDDDLYGDAVNVAARITKHTGPAQILVSRSVYEGVRSDPSIVANWTGKVSLAGKSDKEDVYEIVWTERQRYAALRTELTTAIVQGQLVAPGLRTEDLLSVHPATAETSASAAAQPARSPDERYEILEQLGAGGMGVVYKARDRETGEIVALKLLKPEIAGDERALQRFKDELRLARKITHKNVCRMYDLTRTSSYTAISMELVEGDSLRAVLNRFGNLSVRKGTELVLQVCSALQEAHAQGIVHRDLKPENLMIDRSGNVKVMDFGIARSMQADASTDTGSLVGTPAYLAPEQLDGKPADHRADIYALGLIMYEVFTGAGTFQGDTPMAIVMARLQSDPVPPRQIEPMIPQHVETAILHCLEKDPARRFQSVEELERALTAPVDVNIAPATGAEVSLPRHLAVWGRRDWALVAAGVIGLLAFVFFLFDRTFPYPALKMTIAREQAIDRVKALALKYSPEANSEYQPSLGGGGDLNRYLSDEVPTYGLHHALQELANSSGWSVYSFSKGRNSQSVSLDTEGKVTGLYFGWAGMATSPPERRNPDELLPMALQYAHDIFGIDFSAVPSRKNTYDEKLHGWVTRDGGWTTRDDTILFGVGIPIEWQLPGKSREEIKVFRIWLVGDRLRQANSWSIPTNARTSAPNNPYWFNVWWTGSRRFKPLEGGFVIGCGIVVLALLMATVRRFYSPTVGSILVAGLPVAALAFAVVWAEIPDKLKDADGPPLLMLLILLLLVVPYALMWLSRQFAMRTFADRLLTYPMQSKWHLSSSAGFGVLRGTAIGCAYVALHATLLYFLGERRLAVTATTWFVGDALRTHDTAHLWALAVPVVVAVLVPWLLIAFPVTLAYRATRRTGLVLASVAAFWCILTVGLPGAGAFPLLPMYAFICAQAVVFSLIFLRFDLLTCMAAVLTVETWLVAYPYYRVWGDLKPAHFLAAFLPWALLLCFGVILPLRKHLSLFGQRLRAVFE
jgi:class 3 adenylate cyclase